MDTKLAILTSSTTILGVVLLVLIIVIAVYMARYSKFTSSLSKAIRNDIFCQSQEGKCRLQVTDNYIQPELPLKSEFDKKVALYCTDLIARVELLFYKKNGLKTLKMPPNMTQSKLLTFKDKIIGYVAKSDIHEIVYVAFRGTANEAEWRQDFNFSQVDISVPSDEKQGNFTTTQGDSLACHKGFLNVYSEFKHDLANCLEVLGVQNIVVTGHSLGASLAVLASIDISASYNVHTYTFGCPRVCDRIPTDLGVSNYRLVNTTDVITDLPLSVMPNSSNKNSPWFYTHGGNSVEFTENRYSLTNNHLLPVYIDAVTNMNEK